MALSTASGTVRRSVTGSGRVGLWKVRSLSRASSRCSRTSSAELDRSSFEVSLLVTWAPAQRAWSTASRARYCMRIVVRLGRMIASARRSSRRRSPKRSRLSPEAEASMGVNSGSETVTRPTASSRSRWSQLGSVTQPTTPPSAHAAQRARKRLPMTHLRADRPERTRMGGIIKIDEAGGRGRGLESLFPDHPFQMILTKVRSP